MSIIKVECYSGYRGDQRPVRFFLRDNALEVDDIEDQWYSPSARYFRIRASDGNIYILCHNEDADTWTLSAYLKRSGANSIRLLRHVSQS